MADTEKDVNRAAAAPQEEASHSKPSPYEQKPETQPPQNTEKK